MKRYKVWAVGEDARRQRGVLLERGGIAVDDTRVFLLRTGSDESPVDVVEFDGTPSEVAMLACERTGYTGAVEIRDFGARKSIETHGPAYWTPEVWNVDTAWYHGRASPDGAAIIEGRAP